MTTDEDAVDGNDLSRLEDSDVTDEDVVDRDRLLVARPNDLHATVVLLSVELLELLLLLPVIDRADKDDDGNSNHDGDTLNPLDRGDLDVAALGFGVDVVGVATDGLVDTEGERDGGGDAENDLKKRGGRRVSARSKCGSKVVKGDVREPCPSWRGT